MLKSVQALFTLIGSLALAGSAVFAEDGKFALVHYQKDSGAGLGAFGGKLLHSYGYKDKRLDNGDWQVIGQARSSRQEDSKYIAIYRAAEIAQAEGKRYIKVVSINGKSLSAVMVATTSTGTSMTTYTGPGISYGTRYVLDLKLTDAADPESNCATEVLRPACSTIEAAGAMQEIRPHLKFSDSN